MTVTLLAKPSISRCSPDGRCQHYHAVIESGAPRFVYCDQAQAYTSHWREGQSRADRVVPRTQRVCVDHARAFCERYGLSLP